MRFAVGQEDGLELADLGHIRLVRSPRPDDASSHSFPLEGLFVRDFHADSHPRSANLVGAQSFLSGAPPKRRASRGDGGSDSQHDNNSRGCKPLHAGPSSYQHHASDESDNYYTFKGPRSNALESPGGLASVALSATRSYQRNRHHSPFQSINEAPSYTGKGKGRLLDVDRELGNNKNERRSLQTPQSRRPTIHEKGEFDLGRNEVPSLLRDHTATPFLNDLEFEHRRYRLKKQQRFRLNAHSFCTAVKSENCRVHGKLVPDTEALAHNQERPRFDGSAALCGTVYGQSGLVEEAEVAAEWRRRDENTLRCIDGWWVVVVVLLGVAAVVGFLVGHA